MGGNAAHLQMRLEHKFRACINKVNPGADSGEPGTLYHFNAPSFVTGMRL